MPSIIPLGPIERWPKWLFVIPFVMQWLFLAIRYRSVTLPSVVNPGIEVGGMVGESKQACLDMIGADYSEWVAHSIVVRPGDDAEAAQLAAGLSYPLIAKPDIGWCGYGVRRIEHQVELAAYGAAFPANADYLLQRLVEAPNEAGLLYIRPASAAHGRLAAMTFRHRPQVVGDGHSTVATLIAADPRMGPKVHMYNFKPDVLLSVPRTGEARTLTTVASLRVGGRYEDAGKLITPALSSAVDQIARSMGRFHFGRFDVRFASIESLQEGRFTIIEVNGAGSEAIQNWDPKLSLWQSFSGVFTKQRTLFALANDMRREGFKPVGLRALARAHFRQQRLMRNYPNSN